MATPAGAIDADAGPCSCAGVTEDRTPEQKPRLVELCPGAVHRLDGAGAKTRAVGLVMWARRGLCVLLVSRAWRQRGLDAAPLVFMARFNDVHLLTQRFQRCGGGAVQRVT